MGKLRGWGLGDRAGGDPGVCGWGRGVPRGWCQASGQCPWVDTGGPDPVEATSEVVLSITAPLCLVRGRLSPGRRVRVAGLTQEIRGDSPAHQRHPETHSPHAGLVGEQGKRGG